MDRRPRRKIRQSRRRQGPNSSPRPPFPSQASRSTAAFKAEFEQACADKGLELFLLPPKRPQLNGAVERAQGSWRYEFYQTYDLPERLNKLQPLVDAFAHRFNHYRPHQALGDRTPAEYLQSLSSGASPSHMS